MTGMVETTAVELTDDEVTAFIADPAKITTHEIALEVIAVLDAEIASIQAKLDAAAIEHNGRPMAAERQDWVRRASYASAMKRNERFRVMQRDREIRMTKGPAMRAGKIKDPEANRLKQSRLTEEALTRRADKQARAATEQTKQMEVAQRMRELKERQTFHHHFHLEAKRTLPPETYKQIKATVDSILTQGEGK